MDERLNDGWSFCKLPLGSQVEDLQKAEWTQVDLPHDWLISQQDLYKSNDGWYTRTLSIDTLTDTFYMLRFEGVYMDCSVIVNGERACDHPYGYTTFDCHMTPYLHVGENSIHVHVRHHAPNTRWYSGAGIFRDVTLHVLQNTHIAMDGLYVQVDGAAGTVQVETEIEQFEAGNSAQQPITYALYNPQGVCIQTKSTIVCGEGIYAMAFSVDNPALWSCESPSLYRLITTFGNQTIKTNIGFRTFEMTPDRGLFINGKSLKMKGVCLHHDLGLLGAAYNSAAARRQLVKMQGMGMNALRTSHNPPASDVMNLCDELGILVADELFDMWERPKTPFDNARFFLDTYKEDVRSWVRRDRNHPSLLMWSIGNEILDTHIDGRGLEITLMLKEAVVKNDPKGNAKITIGSNFMPWEGAQNCASAVDIAGYNYGEKYYEQHHAEHPEWIIYGSETASSLASRGIYRFPIEAQILSDSDMQCSALGNSASSWGTKSMEKCLVEDLNTPYSLGQFIWTGTDYIGEPTPYFTRSSYYGQVDTAGYEKDVYYLFQSLWTDAKSNPMIHIGVYWDFNEGQIIDIPVYSNASEVELLLNGNTIGRKKLDSHSIQDCDAKWKVPYQRGILEARGYDDAGKLIAQDVQKSFSCADHIMLTPESTTLWATGEDIALEGMGIPFIDPYEFVAGGLYDVSSGDIGPGNERGASTAHDGWSMFGFTNVNFGDAGTDEVIVPIFTVNDEKYPLYLYCGDPREEGGEQLGTYVYQKPSIWNVYQPITCRLPYPLYGVQTICFALDRKVHVKGFSCTRRVKAYTALPALRCDRAYGDQFEKTERGIESIGNNVTIIYENMNFEGAESVGLSISGKTSLPSQPIHVRMLNSDGEETSQLVEFTSNADISTQRFTINALAGICTISLVFLPGSQFDFYELQFDRQ